MTMMTAIANRARWTLAAGAMAIGALAATACNLNDRLLSPQQPGLIKPGDLATATGAEAIRTGALARLQRMVGGGNNNQENIWLLIGLMTDEFKSSDTFSQRNETDQRNIQSNNGVLQSEYTNVQQTRGWARDAANALATYVADKPSEQAEMWMVMGFAELTAAENFCNGHPFGITEGGIPNYTQPISNADGFQLAIAHFDTALTLITGTDSYSTYIKRAVTVAKARALVDLGNFDQAAGLVSPADVPDDFQYLIAFSQASGQDNEWWTLTASTQRYALGDSADLINKNVNRIFNAVPFASLKDPRVPSSGSSTDTSSNSPKGFDGQTTFVLQKLWARDDPIPLVSGIDARLIQAEDSLQHGNLTGMMTILNALRTTPRKIGVFAVPALATLAAPATPEEARDLFFREKALWTFGRGQRLSDLRRLVRQYNLTQDKAFPSGAFFKNGNYGSDVNFPVTDNEKSNPNFTGCTDRNA